MQCKSKQNEKKTENQISWKDLFFDSKFSELLCPFHKSQWFSFEPNAICMYKQNSENSYVRFQISEFLGIKTETIRLDLTSPFKNPKTIKLSEDLEKVWKNEQIYVKLINIQLIFTIIRLELLEEQVLVRVACL